MKSRFDLHGPRWTSTVITQLDVFLKPSTEFESCSWLTFNFSVPEKSPLVMSTPYHTNPMTAQQVYKIGDKFVAVGLIQHSVSPWAIPVAVIPT